MSYPKTLEKQEKCTILERLDTNNLDEYNRAKELVDLADNENFQLPIDIGEFEDEADKIYFFLHDPKNQKICGMMIIKYLKNIEGEIDAITLKILTARSFKDFSYSKERIGSILINELIHEAKNDPRIDFITIESVAFNWDAHQFYKKMGFKFVGKTYRPIMVIRKKPSFNRFLYIDQIYPETYGYEGLVEPLDVKYSNIDEKIAEKDTSILYSDDEFKDFITCYNFEKRPFELLLDYTINTLQFNDENLGNLEDLLSDLYLFNILLLKSIMNKDLEFFKKLIKIRLSVLKHANKMKLNLPPYVHNSKFEIDDILNYFNKKEINELFFKIIPEGIDKILLVLNVGIKHPYFKEIDSLNERRWQLKEKDEKIDNYLAALGYYFYNKKDILEGVIKNIKNQELKNKMIEVVQR